MKWLLIWRGDIMGTQCKFPIWQAELLIKPSLGIGLRTTWYSDGSIEKEEFQMTSYVLKNIDWGLDGN